MMKFQIFFMFVFFIGVKVEANPLKLCLGMIDFDNHLNIILELSNEEKLNTACPSLTVFLKCLNTVFKEQTGYNVKEFAAHLEGTELDNGWATLFVNIENLVEDMCTEGTEFREEYKATFECYDSMDKNISLQCEEQAEDVYEIFREIKAERGITSEDVEGPCVETAYYQACYGAAIYGYCGDEAFNFYKNYVMKLGFLKSGVCSPDLIHTIKTTLLDSLELSQCHKTMYRVVLDLKKRRK